MTACRPSSIDFDIAASAGWYSAIAGLLAGFALLYILFPLDHETTVSDETDTGNAVVVFACAFFSLLILAFTYAVLAGRTGDGPVVGVAAHEQLLNGTAFEPARHVIVMMTSIVGPLMVLAFQFSNTLDLERYRAASTEASSVQCRV